MVGRHSDSGMPTTPAQEGFRMPAEWARHDRCIMAWPVRRRVFWGAFYELAQATYAAVAHAIARFEPVLVVAAPEEAAEARNRCGREVEVVELPIDDSWMRDSGPIFLSAPDGRLAAADFLFNSWGEKYLPYDRDADIGRRLCEHFGVPRYAAPMVLEGGAITVDGEGTLITTESCLLNPNRNPGMTREEIEEVLRTYLGGETVIWLQAGVWDDWDTDGHVDGVAAFIRPGAVALHMVREKDHPDYATCLENRRRLENATDARGRAIEVVEIDAETTVDMGGRRVSSCYLNFYLANGAVVVPTMGTDDDEAALKQLRAAFPDREVVGVETAVLGYGGGGVHCITQQMPSR